MSNQSTILGPTLEIEGEIEGDVDNPEGLVELDAVHDGALGQVDDVLGSEVAMSVANPAVGLAFPEQIIAQRQKR